MTHKPERQDPHRGGSSWMGGTGEALLKAIIVHARLILLWEAIACSLWRPAAFTCLVFAILISDILSVLNPWIHAGFVAAAALYLIYLIIADLSQFKKPNRRHALRRLEDRNNLQNAPLQALEDQYSSGNDVLSRLWNRYQKKLRDTIGKLKPITPIPQLAKQDPYGLRLIAAFFLVLSIVTAGGNWKENLIAGLTPPILPETRIEHVVVDAWITPPAYTGLAPLFLIRSLNSTDNALIGPDHQVPSGAVLTVQVSGSDEVPELDASGNKSSLNEYSHQAYILERELTTNQDARLLLDDVELSHWIFHVKEDSAPEIVLTEDPISSLQRTLRLSYAAADDYGLSALTLQVERADRPMGSASSSPYGGEEMRLSLDLPIPSRAQYGSPRIIYRDFTQHPWAGGQVRLTLIATDGLGQKTQTPVFEMILPEREFQHPVAAAIVEQRRLLSWDPTRNYQDVAISLNTLAWNHEAFSDKVTVFLSLRRAETMIARAGFDRGTNPEALRSIQELLWKTALYLEDGGLSIAMAELRQAQQALEEAIARGADADELAQLMDNLQRAMQNYLSALAENMNERLQNGEVSPALSDTMQVITTDQLGQMMEQLRQLMENGMMETAQQMLENLGQMMENLQNGTNIGSNSGEQPELQLLQDLQALTDAQRELMDNTFDQLQNQEGAESESNPGQGMQQQLRDQLGDIMRDFGEMLGEIPEAFGRADEFMSEAIDQLGDEDQQGAVNAQGDALTSLQEAAQQGYEAILEQLQNGMGMGQTIPGQTGQRNVDPFGRPTDGSTQSNDNGTTRLPNQSGFDKARTIRDELRRRAGDPLRPQIEQDYIDRLLDQF